MVRHEFMVSGGSSDDTRLARAEQLTKESEELLPELEQRLFAAQAGLVTEILVKQVQTRVSELVLIKPALAAYGTRGQRVEKRIEVLINRLQAMADRTTRSSEAKLERMAEWESKYDELWGDTPGSDRSMEERVSHALLKGNLTLLWASSKYPESSGLLAKAAWHLLEMAKEVRSHMPRAPLSDPPPKPKR